MTECSITNALRLGANQLASTSASPELDAQLLLSHITGLDRLQLVVRANDKLSEENLNQYSYLLRRRQNGEPVAYITETKEFWGLQFKVSPAVLVPRPETEILIENFLSLADSFQDPIIVCDLGTGSGCIAISIAFELKRRSRNCFVLAVDRSLEALKIARQNAEKHNLTDCIQFVCSSWASAIATSSPSFDFVVSNPPYLNLGDTEISVELQYEPATALFAGIDGLDDYRTIFKQLPDMLVKGGIFLGEFGYGQYPALSKLASEMLPAATVDMHPDLRKIPRILELRF